MELAVNRLTSEERAALKNRIARVLSEILSDQLDCKVTLRFVSRGREGENAGAN